MEVNLGFPSNDTVDLFYEIVQRDGMEHVSEELLLKSKDLRLLPLVRYLKTVLLSLIKDELLDEANGYSAGFISCLDIFRRQLDSEEIDLDDVKMQIENMSAWTDYLESEVILLKDQLKVCQNRSECSEPTR